MTNNTEILARDYDFPNDNLKSTGKVVNAYTVIMKQSYYDVVSKETSTIEVKYICESAQGLHYLGIVGVVATISISAIILVYAYLRRNQQPKEN